MAVAEAVVLSAASFLDLQSMDEKQSEIVNVSRLHGDALFDGSVVDVAYSRERNLTHPACFGCTTVYVYLCSLFE